MIAKKYEFAGSQLKLHDGTVLHQIRALKDFSDVKKGDLGGFIESEYNLSHEGDCWIYGRACVHDSAKVIENATVHNHAHIYQRAIIQENSTVYNDAQVYNDAVVSGHAQVCDTAQVSGHACIFDNSKIYGFAVISDYATIRDYARIYDRAKVICMATVSGDAQVYGNAHVIDNSKVYYEAKICGNSVIAGHAHIGRDAFIRRSREYMFMGPVGYSNNYITAYLSRNNTVNIHFNCDECTLKTFEIRLSNNNAISEETLEECMNYLKLIKKHFNVFDKENEK